MEPEITRVWAMPSPKTFSIPPIHEIISMYVGKGEDWIDPFAGEIPHAEFSNDINPLSHAGEHRHAIDYINSKPGPFLGALYDPPYSLRQVKECYNNLGLKMTFAESKGFPESVKDLLAPKIIQGGYTISCGWNSNGFGKNRGFKLLQILLVAHGGRHNDTIVTVERKVSGFTVVG